MINPFYDQLARFLLTCTPEKYIVPKLLYYPKKLKRLEPYHEMYKLRGIKLIISLIGNIIK